jgi:hypothetical protein
MKRISIVGFLLCVFFSSNLAQDFNNRSFIVKKINAPIKIDGQLDEEIWDNSDAADDFWQYFPTDSILADGNTEIKMVYDDDALYIGIICKTTGNDFIIPSLRRDFRAGGNDNITLLFDPFNDGANAFFFGTNPYGVLREGLISGGGGNLGGFTTSWDNKWNCESFIGEDYWVAELEIPFSTLRFNPGSTKWRFNSYRFDMQTNERSTWMQIPRNQWIFSLGYMGDMVWEEPLESSGSNISVIPYAASSVSKDFEEGGDSEFKFNMGGDAKVAVTSGMNLDLTFNPDFSQVEVDQQITDLSRFEIFFPERRQFFLENSDIFGSNGFSSINPFFSRRIGVATDTLTGTTVQNTIYGGARLSGKINDDWRVGLMSMQTGSDEMRGIPSSNFSVASLQRKVGARSFVSIVAVNKQVSGEQENVDINSYNRVIGLDYNLASADNVWNGKVFLHRSFTPNESDNQMAHGMSLEYRVRKIQLNWEHQYVGDGYNAEVGFVRRTNYYSIQPQMTLFFYPKGGYLNQHGPSIEYEQVWQPDLGKTDQSFSLGWEAETRDNGRINLSINREYVYLFDDFDPTGSDATPLSEGTDYTYTFFRGSISTDQSKLVSFRFSPYLGGYFDGKRYGLSGSIDMRFQPYANIGINYALNRFDMNYLEEKQSTFLAGPRIDLTFNKELFFTTFIQYNSQSQNTNINARFQWRFAPVSDFFLVWADNYFTGNDPSDRFAFNVRNRSIVAKLTYWLNL